MNEIYVEYISRRLQVAPWQVAGCVALLDEGATVPFISRYRKERTGALDETQVMEVRHWYLVFAEMEKRKQAIISTVEQQGKLTPELRLALERETDPRALEDLYLPFRPHRRTRALIAREKGLEPLADEILKMRTRNPEQYAQPFVKGDVRDVEDALQGARDIIAERIAENAPVRSSLRELYGKWGTVVSRPAKGCVDAQKADKYRNYSEFSERLDRIPSHRLLAILRGVEEGALSIKVEVKQDYALERISRRIYDAPERPSQECRRQIARAIEDSYKRLLHPSIENESLSQAKERADVEAIKVFGENLRQLLLAPPLGQKRTLAIDPGFRTGCKVVCLDAQGALLHTEVIYPHPPKSEKIASMKKISFLVEAYKIEVIAIGNGTAGRETEDFIKKIALPQGVRVYSVSEDGASVYSASPLAREEFPDYDLTVRGAVSIGRRLMDPLAELVKIDPKSIGVGQYQHDVDQGLLKETLDSTVEACVNSVGVNLNTASCHLLSYVSGIGAVLSRNIVEYRTQNGPFASRSDLKKVARLGDKAYEQCAAFLRIPGAANPLDNSAVHPERYSLVEKMASDMSLSVRDLIGKPEVCSKVDLSRYVDGDVGLPTLNDIIGELSKPGRDPRSGIKVFEFSDGIRTIEDVKVGMVLPCIVTNITAFGAFVDLGIHENGLIHVSQVCGHYVSSPSQVLKINQQLQAKVISVDLARKRIGLSLKDL